MLRRLFPSLILFTLLTAVAAASAWRYIHHLDATVVEKFSGPRWQLPSRIYSDSFLIYPGLDLEAAGLFDRLRRLNYRENTHGPLRKGDFRRTASGLDILSHDFAYPGQAAHTQPVHLELRGDILERITDLTSGVELFSFYLEPEVITGVYESNWEERRVVSLAEVPPLLVHAIITTEDQRFFAHHGIDASGVLRALLVNLRHGRIVQGGSTLTQQLMKNFFLSEERTWRRKIREAVMAIIAERRYSKHEILENYLNEIYLGQNGLQGIFGIWEASRFYFARPPHELTLAETALLAGLIRAPNSYSPYRQPERAEQRRNTVLGMLAKSGTITAGEYAAAVTEPLRITPVHGGRNAAPYFVDFLQQDLERNYPREVLTSRGLSIFTSLDIQLQELAERAVGKGLAELERRHPQLTSRAPERRVQAALIAIQPQTGTIKAMVGGRDYQSSQFNRSVHGRRQPGSVFKPFVYLAAFEAARNAAEPISPVTWLDDEPFSWVYDGRVWSPANYRDRYLGPVTVRRALELSLNSATARLAHKVGLAPIRELARRMGISAELPPYPALVLGALEASPLQVAQAYAVIANQGLRAQLRVANKVVDRRGQLIERRPLAVVRIASPEAAYILTHLLEGVLDRGTGMGVRERGFTRPAAGKTGTTNEARDAWFAGFTPELLAVVWVGFDHGEPLGLTGAEAALPIWTAFMSAATAAYPASSFRPPAGVALVRIDPYTGDVATPHCPQSIGEAFWKGQEPTTTCAVHAAQGLTQGLPPAATAAPTGEHVPGSN